MNFENTFEVKAPIDDVWRAMLDVERVAPCMPGAEVLEKSGDNAFKVGVKVKLGPVSMQYRGDVEIVERDEKAHRAVMRASAKELRGQGTANAEIATVLAERNGGTQATIQTQLQMRGRAAAMGRGVMQDVASRLVDEFAENLGQMLGGEARETEAAPEAPAGEPPSPSPPPPRPAAGELSAASLAGDVIAGRLRDPRKLAAAFAIIAFVAYRLGKRRR